MFVNLLDFFIFTCYKKTNGVSIYKIIAFFFLLWIILDGLLKNCIKLGIILDWLLKNTLSYINIGLVFFSNVKVGGSYYWPIQDKLHSKNPALEP